MRYVPYCFHYDLSGSLLPMKSLILLAACAALPAFGASSSIDTITSELTHLAKANEGVAPLHASLSPENAAELRGRAAAYREILSWFVPVPAAGPANVRSSIDSADLARIPASYWEKGNPVGMLKWDAAPGEVVYYEIKTDNYLGSIVWRTKGAETELPYIGWLMINTVNYERWMVRAVLKSGISEWVASRTLPEKVAFLAPIPPSNGPVKEFVQ